MFSQLATSFIIYKIQSMKTFIIIILVILLIGGIFLFINSKNQDELIDSIDKTDVGNESMIEDEESMMKADSVYKFESRNGDIEKVEGDDDLALSNATFQFTGFGPGKSHVGTFQNIDATVETDAEGNVIGGILVFDVDSVKTDTEAVDNHLKTDDFFNIAEYPNVTFRIKSISESSISGDLSFLGVTKSITIPATITKTENTTEVDIDTVIDISEFGFKFAGIKQEVRVEANAVVER